MHMILTCNVKEIKGDNTYTTIYIGSFVSQTTSSSLPINQVQQGKLMI